MDSSRPLPPEEFPALAVLACNQYLSYLDNSKNFAGKKIISVYTVTRDKIRTDFILTLTERVQNPDACEFWINGKLDPDIKILKYASRNRDHYLRIRVKTNPEDFFAINPDGIKIVSDMRFLVRRLMEFYHGRDSFFMPRRLTPLPPLPEHLLEGLSSEQYLAVQTIPLSPISYVNGAPGTGKTNRVLSRCILRYVLAEKRVMLLAPTNNAVEQMLRGVLPVLKESNIDLRKVYRLGISSEEFSAQYPEVVGDQATDLLYEQLNEELKKEQEKLSAAAAVQARRETAQIRQNLLESIHAAVIPLLKEIIEIRKHQHKLSSELRSTQANKEACQAEYCSANRYLLDLQREKLSREKVITANRELSNRLYYVLFNRAQRKIFLEENKRLIQELIDIKIKVAKSEIDCVNLKRDLDTATAVFSAVNEKYFQCSDSILHISKTIQAYVQQDVAYQEAVQNFLHSEHDSFEPLEAVVSAASSELSDADNMLASISLAEIEAQIKNIQEKLGCIGATAKQQQKQTALVIAGTVDASLNYLANSLSTPSLPICHIFLDEAGYTSIIRGMVPFCHDAPITFLGDHRQLPPVCEMNQIKPDAAPSILWSLSVAYYPDLFYGSLLHLYTDCYCALEQPSFQDMVYLPLNISYRFGPLLAGVLAKHIYDKDFCGAGDENFEIIVAHAKYRPGPYNRSSLSEAESIQRLIGQYEPNNVAILAPYNNQVKLLQQTLPHAYRRSVMTVHRAQGREWDTVVLSVTDTYNRYFTDSRLPIGKQIINTAISRAKHRLILTCDSDVWTTLPDQIINDLIGLATHIK